MHVHVQVQRGAEPLNHRDAPGLPFPTVQATNPVPSQPARHLGPQLALPGPVADTMLVPAPDVGWADDRSVAAAYGCTCRDRR
jgi:hypothetical protein